MQFRYYALGDFAKAKLRETTGKIKVLFGRSYRGSCSLKKIVYPILLDWVMLS